MCVCVCVCECVSVHVCNYKRVQVVEFLNYICTKCI